MAQMTQQIAEQKRRNALDENQHDIDKIVARIISKLPDHPLSKTRIRDFILTAINGDSFYRMHVIFLPPPECVVFALTPRRLVRIDIGHEFTSKEYNLDDIFINWTSGDYEEVAIMATDGSFSLQYIRDDDKNFFQDVSKARLKIGEKRYA